MCVVLFLLPWEKIMAATVMDSYGSLPFFLLAHCMAIRLENPVSGLYLCWILVCHTFGHT